MTDHILEVAETIQTASIVSHPSAAHDINPSTAASEKQPVVTAPASDAGSLSSDIVDPSRVIRPLRRRHTLPPLPDLRFEQSYLASLKDADTWGRVAWITVRDQVPRTSMKLSDERHSEDCIAYNIFFRYRFSSLSSKAQSGPSPSPAGASGTATPPSADTPWEAESAGGGMESTTGSCHRWAGLRIKSSPHRSKR
jgi:hypothetical protein